MPTTLSERVKQSREKLGKSQKEFAQLIGASYRAQQDYEAGVTMPGAKVLEKICLLGFNGTWLLTGKGIMMQPKTEEMPTLSNNELLEAVMLAVDEYLLGIQETIPIEKKVKLICALYRIAEKERKTVPEKQTVVDLTRLVLA